MQTVIRQTNSRGRAAGEPVPAKLTDATGEAITKPNDQ
jgi:hypothetical protein